MSPADLTLHNSFGLSCKANRCIKLQKLSDLVNLSKAVGDNPWFVLGGGSNVILPENYHGTVVCPDFRGIQRLADAPGIHIRALAGENWHDFVHYCLVQGWWGLENLAFIPGTVGAAPIQNIGAYGLEVAQRIVSIQYWDCQTQSIREIAGKDCAFAYRDSIFKQGTLGQVIIVSLTFALMPPANWRANLGYKDLAHYFRDNPPPTAPDIFDAVIAIRQSKLPDPKKIGNVGSFFKNPIVSSAQTEYLLLNYPSMPHYPQADGQFKLAAGWLIDQAGLKGLGADLGSGRIGVHSQQALVLVNLAGTGRAIASDVQILAQIVIKKVFEQFQVALSIEPIFIKN